MDLACVKRDLNESCFPEPSFLAGKFEVCFLTLQDFRRMASYIIFIMTILKRRL